MTLVNSRRTVIRKNLPLPSSVSCLKDLILLAQTKQRYANINMEMLWRILPQLISINSMIGMKELKNSLFHQTVFFLQQLTTNTNNDYIHTMILGGPGTGKCLAKNTPVLMSDGTIRMVQSIAVNEQIMGDDSTPRTIMSICKGFEQMYLIQHRYAVNKSHILSLVNKSQTEFIDISIDDFLSQPKSYRENYYAYKTSIQFPSKSQPIDPYVYGFCVAGHYTVDDISYLDISNSRIQKYMTSKGIAKYLQHNIFQITNPILTTKSITSEFKINDPSKLRWLLAGVYDSIGVILLKGKYVILNKIHAEDIIFIHNILGLDYSTQLRTITIDDTIVTENIIITLNDIHQLPSLIQESSCDVNSTKRILVLEPISVEEAEHDEYYGFELDGNGRFVLGDCLVTHNTTIAKIIGELYKEMGILSPDGVFKIAKRDDFVAEYLGQSAVKTRKLLESCLGGVLFIDEIYSLGPTTGDKDSFSKEAIDTLNLFLSENSQTFCCIVAGYEEEVRTCFLNINKGLERRFQWIHKIESYSIPELAEIFFKLVGVAGWKTTASILFVEQILKKNKECFKHFGGDIENLLTKCKMSHARRIFSERNPSRFVITEGDMENAMKIIKQHQLNSSESMVHMSIYG